MSVTPRSCTVLADPPVRCRRGLPDCSVTTSTSRQRNPSGPPSALARASLAANLAAWERFGRLPSAGEHLLHQPRVADQRVLPPLQVADVHADADNHVASLAARDQAASAGSCGRHDESRPTPTGTQPQLPSRGKEGTEETRELFSHAWNSAHDLVMLSPKPYGNSGVSPGLFPQL